MSNIKVGLEIEGNTGELVATIVDPHTPVEFTIEGLPKGKISKATTYLNKTREFRIPQSDQIDDFKVMEGKPVDNETFFRLGLCTLMSNTGIRVIW